MKTSSTTPTARDRFNDLEHHVWNARGLAKVLLEMAWGFTHDDHPETFHPMFLKPADLRMTLELLAAEIDQADDLIGNLESNLTADDEGE
jgi:hypothetical protein